MKSTTPLLLLLLGILFTGCTSSVDPPTLEEVFYESYEVALPALLGNNFIDDRVVSPPYGRLAEFRLPSPIVRFGSVRMVIGGHWTMGLVEERRYVNGVAYLDTFNLMANLTLRLRPVETAEKAFEVTLTPYVSGLDHSGNFQYTEEFPHLRWWDPQTGGLLLDTDVIATLTFSGPVSGLRSIISPSIGSITELRLEFLDAVVLKEVP